MILAIKIWSFKLDEFLLIVGELSFVHCCMGVGIVSFANFRYQKTQDQSFSFL